MRAAAEANAIIQSAEAQAKAILMKSKAEADAKRKQLEALAYTPPSEWLRQIQVRVLAACASLAVCVGAVWMRALCCCLHVVLAGSRGEHSIVVVTLCVAMGVYVAHCACSWRRRACFRARQSRWLLRAPRTCRRCWAP